MQMILRVMLVGTKMGPGVFVIAEAIGNAETVNRIEKACAFFRNIKLNQALMVKTKNFL